LFSIYSFTDFYTDKNLISSSVCGDYVHIISYSTFLTNTSFLLFYSIPVGTFVKGCNLQIWNFSSCVDGKLFFLVMKTRALLSFSQQPKGPPEHQEPPVNHMQANAVPYNHSYASTMVFCDEGSPSTDTETQPHARCSSATTAARPHPWSLGPHQELAEIGHFPLIVSAINSK
jgi:hypothetical protein